MLSGRPVKWVEDRSENLMSTGFARDYVMKGRIAATADGRLLGLGVDVIADHGAFNATAQPSRYPAGSGCLATSAPTSNSSATVSTRITPDDANNAAPDSPFAAAESGNKR